MPCCVPILQSFTNKESTSVSYPATLQALYGRYPKVQVLYWDDDAGEYYVSNNFTRVEFKDDAVVVDHGGSASGVIKVY